MGASATRAQRQQAILALVAGASLGLAGCSRTQELFCHPNCDAGGSPSDASGDAGPATLLGLTRGTPCTECLLSTCEQEVQDCVDAPGCAAYETCNAPSQSYQDRLFCNAEGTRGSGDPAVSGPFQLDGWIEYRDCVDRSCPQACAMVDAGLAMSPDAGPAPEDFWDCRGKFDFPVSWTVDPADGEIDFSVLVTFSNGAPAQGTKLRLCDVSDSDCDSPAAEGTTDEKGIATLAYSSTNLVQVARYLEVTREADSKHGEVRMLQYFLSPSPLDGGSTPVIVSDQADLDDRGVAPPLPGHGHVSVVALDCIVWFAGNLVLEVARPGETTKITYGVGTTPEALRTERGVGLASATDLPEGPNTAALRDFDSGEIMARRDFIVRAGWLTRVLTWPLTAREADALSTAADH